MEGSSDELEKVIGRVRDVLRARVVRDENGKVREVRVLTSESRAAQKVARDVTTAVRTQGEDVALDSVHVSQMASEDWSAIMGHRVRLEGVMFETRNTEAECRVSLALHDHNVTGSAKGPASTRESLNIVARATLEAITGCLLDPSPDLTLEGVSVVNIASVETIVVLVSVAGFDGLDYFSGSSPVRFDQRVATARATLNAMNRKFALLLKGSDR